MSKTEKEKLKVIQEKCLALLSQMLKEEDNKYCVDCDAKGPRWASWNLGIFLCIRCAGIHRNLGVHISRVKSVNLDTWTAEQVGSLQQMGNSKGRAVYEANLPDNFRRPTSDSSLEVFIRAKYEHKKYIAKEWVPTAIKPAFDTEEIRKKKDEKRRQKTGNSVNSPPSVPVARPKASSVEPKNVQQDVESQPRKSAATNNDLLGLDVNSKSSASNQDDMFGLFESNQSSNQTNTSAANDAFQSSTSINGQESVQAQKVSDEDDFFKQSSGDGKKLTNESILSLFANNATSTNNQQQQMFGMPGGMYVNQSPSMPQQGAQNGMVVNSGYSSMPNGVIPGQNMMGQSNSISMGQSNQMKMGQPNQMAMGQPNQMTMGQQNQMAMNQKNQLAMGQPNQLAMGQPNQMAMGQPNQMAMGQPNQMAMGQMNAVLQQQQSGMASSNPFLNAQAQQMPGGFGTCANPNITNNASQFSTNNPQQQNLMTGDTNDLMGWNAPKMPILGQNRGVVTQNKPHASSNLTNQIQQQMSAMQLQSMPASQGWNQVTGQMMAQQPGTWMPQNQAAMGHMPPQGQTLSNNLWK